MTNRRFNQPPRALRRLRVTFDNLVLVPGTALADIDHWQTMANKLPQGEVLIVLPDADSALTTILRTVATHFEAAGYPVTTLPASPIH